MNPNKSITKAVQYLQTLEVVGKLNSDDDSYENIYLLKKKDGSQMYVQKCVHKRKFSHLEPYVHEIMKHNSHFITLHNVVCTPEQVFLTMDFIKDGDLYDLIKNSNFRIDESKCRKLILQLVNALNELHKHQIVHNDVKLENLLYSREKHKIYVCDYGLVHIIGTPSLYDGTTVYFSPEKIKEEPNQPSFDWWAVGIVAYEILDGDYPYRDKDGGDMNDVDPLDLLTYQSRKLPKIKNASATANDFIQKMLCFDVSKRLHSYNDIIRHPFLSM
jgi:serine/threonine protein kinase